jgi:hypothetical protein
MLEIVPSDLFLLPIRSVYVQDEDLDNQEGVIDLSLYLR